ncbi:MAG TPA: SpoVR family protein [Candidatus Polarisedimenticolia bacterium]|nr:SpoVR family protein [Candidatus Polarisedimenticolia bacterium]
MSLPHNLETLRREIRGYAREYGLDFFEVFFEILTYDQMNEIAAYGGFPTRYPHWRFGMEYEHLKKSYSYGLHKIYEMVINNDPCTAYLLECNSLVDQKIVMAHVYGHSDFFKNNVWFSRTNRKMLDEMANHATRIRRYMEKHGVEAVEDFIDVCLSIESLIDPHSAFIARERPRDQGYDEEEKQVVHRMRSKDYMMNFINPPDFLEAQRSRMETERQRARRLPEEPARDVMKFLIDQAPLENWQREVLSIIREEAYYFAPQGQTKIMNEGWASYWHSKIMTEKALTDAEVIDYADHHSGTVASHPGRLNPYKLGLELFKDIEDRWNKGRFGKDYEECDDIRRKQDWDLHLGLGRQKIFEVRRLHNDVTFIDTFLTPEFCAEHKLFAYAFNKKTNAYQISAREFRKVKDQLLFGLTNHGQPFIFVTDANHANRGELFLQHRHEGLDLKHDWARETLRNIQRIWSRPVHLLTMVEEKPRLLGFDGKDHTDAEPGSDLAVA